MAIINEGYFPQHSPTLCVGVCVSVCELQGLVCVCVCVGVVDDGNEMG